MCRIFARFVAKLELVVVDLSPATKQYLIVVFEQTLTELRNSFNERFYPDMKNNDQHEPLPLPEDIITALEDSKRSGDHSDIH